MSKKWLSIILALALVLILLPGSVLASAETTSYQSSSDVFPSVEMISVSTNTHTRALMAWYQQGSAHIAIKSTHMLQHAQIGSYKISAESSSDLVDLHPAGTTISIDGVSYNANLGLIGNTKDARWTVFKFPVDETFADSGSYVMSVTGNNNSPNGHSLGNVLLQINFAEDEDNDNTPAPTDGAANPETTPAPTDGAANPETTPAPTDGATNPETTPAPTDGATNPETTPAPTDGATNPETTPAPTDGAANPETTPTPTDGEANPETTPAPTDGATNPETTPTPVISAEPETESSEGSNDSDSDDNSGDDEDNNDQISVVDDQTPQGSGKNNQGSDSNGDDQTIELGNDQLPLSSGSVDLDAGDKQSGGSIDIPDLEVPQVRPGNANNLFQELVNILDDQIPQTGEKVTSVVIGIILLSLAAVLVFLRRRSLKH